MPAAGSTRADTPPRAESATTDRLLVDAQARRIRELEQQLAERTRILTEAAEVLVDEVRRRESMQVALLEAQRFESVGQLAGGMVHDLRNALGIMAAGYELCRIKQVDADLLRLAESGSRAYRQARGLIDSLLGVIRGSDGNPRLLTSGSWLVEMQGLLAHAAGSANRCLVRGDQATWPVLVIEHRLGASLINLVINARDALPNGGEIIVGVVDVHAGEPRPAGAPEGEYVLFSVADNGFGMPPEVLARAVEPLFSTKGPGRGTGLGLSMVKAFAQASGGHLHIASLPEVGTRVELYLPRAGKAAETAAFEPTTGEADAGVSASTVAGMPGTILMLVDGNDLSRSELAARLRALGCEVVEATGTAVAMALRHRVPRLSAVLVDAEISGGAAAFIARLRVEQAGLPALVVVRGDVASAGAEHAGCAGSLPTLSRNSDLPALQAALAQMLHHAGRLDADRDALLDRLAVRLRSPELLAVLLSWRAACSPGRLPRIQALDGFAPALAPFTFSAIREADGGMPRFRLLRIGAALAARLGSAIPGEPIIDEETLGALSAAYRRAAESGLPSYEYLRYGLSGGSALRFERLLLPAADDGCTVSHLIGIALFQDAPPDNRAPAPVHPDASDAWPLPL